MKQWMAFTRKEWMEQVRTGRFWIVLTLFALFGILSPALAKMTPWMYEMLSETMEEQGLIIRQVEVTALMSWQQYYKNISLMLIVLVVIFSGVLTGEYQKGTLVNILTKGLPRWKVIAAKAGVQLAVWSICYWTAFLITYAYTVYFWDNSIIKHWFMSGVCIYLMGIWLLTLIYLGSVLLNSNMAVILFTGAVVALCYLIGIVPKAAGYLPTKLLEAGNMLSGAAAAGDFTAAAAVTAGSGILFMLFAVILFDKKRI